MKNKSIYAFSMMALMAALSYVCFTFIQFKIPLPGGDATSVHLGNMVPVLGSLLFGGIVGGLGGAIGMTIGDLMDPIYIVYAPKTFLLKFCIGFITGVLAHKVFKINSITDKVKIRKAAIISATAGLVFNAVFDPVIGYFYKLLILGKPAADITLAWNIGACVTNAVISLLVAVPLYLALRPTALRYSKKM